MPVMSARGMTTSTMPYGEHFFELEFDFIYKNGEPAPDPTAAFLGDDWWKLPATLGSLLFALWGVMEWAGAAKVIVDAIR